MLSALGLLGTLGAVLVCFSAMVVGAAIATYGIAQGHDHGRDAERTFHFGLGLTGVGFLGLVALGVGVTL